MDSKLPVDWYDILVQQGIDLKNNSYRKRAKNDYLCGNVTEDLKVYLGLKKQLKEEENQRRSEENWSIKKGAICPLFYFLNFDFIRRNVGCLR